MNTTNDSPEDPFFENQNQSWSDLSNADMGAGTTIPLNDPRLMDVEIASIYEMFGKDTVLVALRKGTPPKGWQEMSVASTVNVAHQRDLQRSDIGVVTGPTSGGLCALRFREPKHWQELVAANPVLAQSFTLQHAGHITVFFRMPGVAWPNLQLETATFIGAAQVIPILSRPSDDDHGVLVASPVAMVAFEEVAWSLELKIGLLPPYLIPQYGPLVRMDRSKRRLNYQFWAAYFVKVSNLLFYPSMGFCQYTSEGLNPVTREYVQSQFSRFFQDFAQSPGQEHLIEFIERTSLNGVVKAMEVIARTDEGNIDSLWEFRRSMIVASPGQNFTTTEAYPAYKTFCALCGYPILSRYQFGERLKAMLAPQGYAESNSVERAGKQVRGYRNLALRDSGTPGALGTDEKQSAPAGGVVGGSKAA